MAGYRLRDVCRKGAEPLMRWLIPAARLSGTVTYGEIAARLEKELGIRRIFPTHIGAVAGTLADILLKGDPDLPLINVLVVNQKGLPGSGINGYLRDRYGKFTKTDRPAICARAARDVYRYKAWDQVYRDAFGKDAPDDNTVALAGTERDGKSPDGRRGGGPESPEHKRLKQYVCDHPAVLGLKLLSPSAETEFALLSGDEVDVCVVDERRTVLVEVKSRRSNYCDLRRGIYQCVKYRAVMRAQHDGIPSPVHVVLVTEAPLPTDLVALAKRLDVELKQVTVRGTRAGQAARDHVTAGTP